MFVIGPNGQVVWQAGSQVDTPQGRQGAAALGINTLSGNDPYAAADTANTTYTALQGTPLGQANQTAYDEARTRYQQVQDRDYQLQVDAAKRQRDDLALRVGQQQANEWYNKQLVQLSKDRLAQENQQFNTTSSGYDANGNPTLANREFQTGTVTGLINTAAGLSGPADYAKYKAKAGGVAGNIGSIPGLNWNTGGQVGNTTFAGTPQVKSIQSILGDFGLTGGAGAGASGASNDMNGVLSGALPSNLSQYDQQIYQAANQFASNPQGAAPGWWESKDPGFQSAIQDAATKQGHDWSTVMSRYGGSKWGANIASPLAA